MSTDAQHPKLILYASCIQARRSCLALHPIAVQCHFRHCVSSFDYIHQRTAWQVGPIIDYMMELESLVNDWEVQDSCSLWWHQTRLMFEANLMPGVVQTFDVLAHKCWWLSRSLVPVLSTDTCTFLEVLLVLSQRRGFTVLLHIKAYRLQTETVQFKTVVCLFNSYNYQEYIRCLIITLFCVWDMTVGGRNDSVSKIRFLEGRTLAEHSNSNRYDSAVILGSGKPSAELIVLLSAIRCMRNFTMRHHTSVLNDIHCCITCINCIKYV